MSNKPKNSDAIDLPPGATVGSYRIERHLGSGGMAEVYYAIHEGLQRPAALKILRPSLATDETHLQRFLQEARAAASLVHPNIVQVYDVGQSGDLRYIAQEYVPGSNLRHYLSLPLETSTAPYSLAALKGSAKNESDAASKSGATDAGLNSAETPAGSLRPDRQLTIPEALSILLQILAALNKSAASGIVHRDIKPENIMLTQDGEVKVADFGLARLLYGDDPQLTRAGTTLGTPMYMSPEQIQEGSVDIRSDLYSLGVTLFHMLTGRPPFTGETPLALAMQHVQAPVPDLYQYRHDLPGTLSQLVDRLLRKSPEERFNNPKEVLDFLRANRDGDLAECWPDQTVPLPGAAGTGPLQATLQLQLKLRQQRRAWGAKVLRGVAVAVLVAIAFVGSNWATYSSPASLLSNADTAIPDIEMRSSVEEQYRWALLNSQADPIEKWKAVEQYFPAEDKSEINLLYAGLSKLQLARAYQKAGEIGQASEQLRLILDNGDMMLLLKAHAWLQTAELEREQQHEAEMSAAVRQAKSIRNGAELNEKDRDQLDGAVRLMAQEIKDQWFE